MKVQLAWLARWMWPRAEDKDRSLRPCSDDRALRERVDAFTRWDVAQDRWGGTRERRRRSFAYRERPEPIPSFRGPVEQPPPAPQERTGICCSGGGIRSAAFNLGALQVLQEREELQRSSYLAAVSGGSYIAAAFSMVATTRGPEDSDPELIAAQPPFAPGSPEEQYLRNRSSYLAPDGFDKLFLAYRVLLGLLFNVVFLATPLFAVMLIAGWWPYRAVYPDLVACQGACGHHVPLGCWLPVAVLGSLSLLLGLWVLLFRIKLDRDRRALQVWSTRLLLATVFAALLLIELPALVGLAHTVGSDLGRAGKAAVVGGGSLAGLIAGVLAYVREAVLTPKKALAAIEEGNRVLGSKVRLAVAYAAAALAGPALAIAVMAFALSVSLSYSSVPSWWGIPVPLGLGIALLAAFGVAYLFSDLTSLSLHPFYKRRLCTAFALKRITAAQAYEIGPDLEKEMRESESGREFLNTPVAVERDFDTLVSLSDTALDGKSNVADTEQSGSPARTWPSLIVCAAANVSDPGATPPGRSVTGFTFSAESIGGPLIGAAKTTQVEEVFDGRPDALRTRDLSLPAAVAISGAAIAPSMGKMTRRPLTFLLALANIRLGVWVPNPRLVRAIAEDKDRAQKERDSAQKGHAPIRNGSRQRRLRLRLRRRLRRDAYGRPRPIYLLLELLGYNRVDAKFLFVTDGGHYENLGLVELLRRGCTEIYCFDASADAHTFSTLGDAVALARSELGVEIKIDPSALAPPEQQDRAADDATGIATSTDIAKENVTLGTFEYRGGRQGRLLYARCVMTPKVPVDVAAHHREESAFPDTSTIDQLYTDQKFESYRVLGELAGRNATERMAKERRR
jgi:Patatin-like phospholipase